MAEYTEAEPTGAEPTDAASSDAVPTQAQDKAHVKEMAAHLAEVEEQTDEARQRSKRDHLLMTTTTS